MEYYKFSNGDRMPVMGIGTWRSDPEKVYDAIVEAVKYGYRHIDCAYIYRNEAIVGQALEHVFKSGLARREDIWVTSKLWNSFHKRKQAIPAIENTLKDLRLDYLDLYLIHWPVALKEGILFPEKPEDCYTLGEVPLEETWKGMEDCLDVGLTRHIGVSNFSISKMETVIASAHIKPEVNQIEVNPYMQQRETVKFCRDNGICVTAYSPLGKGDIARERGLNLFRDPLIIDIAKRRKCTVPQVLLRWALQKGLVVIPKSVTPSRIRENFDAVDVHLTDVDMMEITTLDKENRISTGNAFLLPGGPYTGETLWE